MVKPNILAKHLLLLPTGFEADVVLATPPHHLVGRFLTCGYHRREHSSFVLQGPAQSMQIQG